MRAEATIKVKPRREDQLRAKGLSGLLELVFYRKPSLALLAIKVITHMEERQHNGNPMGVSEWRNWIEVSGVTQRQFYNVVNKLAGVGMIRRERGTYRVVGDFSKSLKMMAEVWDSRSALIEK